MNCLFEAVASIWIRGYRLLNPKMHTDSLVQSAKNELHEAITHITSNITSYNEKIDTVAAEVRSKRNSLSKQSLNILLLKSKKLRMEQKKMDDKRNLMETQLQALESNEFNKSVLSTLQTSSKALQRMGLNKDLQHTDKIISELEEGMAYSNDVSIALGTGMNPGNENNIDEDDLQAELDDILGVTVTDPEVDACLDVKLHNRIQYTKNMHADTMQVTEQTAITVEEEDGMRTAEAHI
jgi:hypothetical protein